MKKNAIGIMLFAGVCLVGSAQAQYYVYGSGKPAVETNFDIIDNMPAAISAKATKLMPLAPAPAVVEEEPLRVQEIAPMPEPAPVMVEEKRLKQVEAERKPAAAPLVQVKKIQPSEKAPAEQQKTPAVETAAEEAHDISEPVGSPAVPSLSDLALEFVSGAGDLTEEHKRKVDAVVAYMGQADGVRLQVRAFAVKADGNMSDARRLSLSRALAVRSYLMDKGINPARIDVRALGSEVDAPSSDRVELIFAR